MPCLDVKAVVGSIVSAFGTGLDALRSIRTKQPPRKLKRSQKRLENEASAEQSLETAPREIQAEYDKFFSSLGELFAAGDPAAHTSLAHILLVLNSGIMQILSTSIASDTNTTSRASNSLMTLSNSSKRDTIRALNQLHRRLLEHSNTQRTSLRGHRNGRHRAEHDSERANRSRSSVDPKNALLREKKKSSDVEGRTSSRHSRSTSASRSKTEYAWVRSRMRPSLSTADSNSRSNSIGSVPITSMVEPPEEASRPRAERHSSSPSTKKLKETPTQLQSHLGWQNKTSVVADLSQVPLIMPTEQRLSSRRTERLTPSTYSFMSDSTKIGEIPEHKWITGRNERQTSPHWPPPPFLPIPQIPAEINNKPSKSFWRNPFKSASTGPILA